MIVTSTIIALLVLGVLIKQYQHAQPTLNLESFSSPRGGCDSCTLEENRIPPLSGKGMLLPYPRYEWSYRPEEYDCKSKDVLYNPFNGVCNNNKKHTYNPLGLYSKHSLHGIMPDRQLFYVKNRMGGVNSSVYSQKPIGIPTNGSVKSVTIQPSM